MLVVKPIIEIRSTWWYIKKRYYNVFIKVIALTAVLKTTENYIVLPVKAITVIAFGASLKFSLFPNSEIYLINKIYLKN